MDNDLKQLTADYMQIWDAGRQDLLDEFAHEDLTVDHTHFEKTYEGIADYKLMLKQTHTYFPDLEITLNTIIPNEAEKSVMVIWEYNGTHQSGNLFGVEASGKEVILQGMTLLEVINGQVAREEGIVDNLSLIIQLGIM